MYDGEWRNGKYSGYGVLNNVEWALESDKQFNEDLLLQNLNKILNKLDKYEGEFSKGVYHGIGTLYFRNGGKLDGKFLNGKLKGKATFIRSNGDQIVAEWDESILISGY